MPRCTSLTAWMKKRWMYAFSVTSRSSCLVNRYCQSQRDGALTSPMAAGHVFLAVRTFLKSSFGRRSFMPSAAMTRIDAQGSPGGLSCAGLRSVNTFRPRVRGRADLRQTFREWGTGLLRARQVASSRFIPCAYLGDRSGLVQEIVSAPLHLCHNPLRVHIDH